MTGNNVEIHVQCNPNSPHVNVFPFPHLKEYSCSTVLHFTQLQHYNQ